VSLDRYDKAYAEAAGKAALREAARYPGESEGAGSEVERSQLWVHVKMPDGTIRSYPLVEADRVAIEHQAIEADRAASRHAGLPSGADPCVVCDTLLVCPNCEGAAPEGAVPVTVQQGHQKRDGLWYAVLCADEPVEPGPYDMILRTPTEGSSE
jgi:hypothetical protein